MPDDHRLPSLIDRLRQTVGPEHVTVDEAARALMSQDVWSRGGLAGCVVAPGTTQETADVVAVAAQEGAAILPRGGGMSYTSGYVQPDAGGVVVDTRRLSRILDINATDMTVSVEAGVTWKALYEALQPLGLRTPFWGPLSGISSTIGGGLSQNNAFFGAGTFGPTAESVLSVTAVLADGSVVRTGTAGAANAKPFYRHYGPDLTGLFLGDTGALGVKTEATLRLIPYPEEEGWASFSFDAAGPWIRAISSIARAGVGCEVFGFDPNLARVRMRRASLLADAGALAKVIGAQKSLLEGLKEGAKMALAGRSFLDEADYSLHVVVEGRARAAVEHDLALVRKLVAIEGGRDVENTIPKVIRANPFTPLNNVLGPEGERWAPVHGIVAHSDATAAFEALEAVFARMGSAFDTHGVTTGYLITTLSTTGFLIEPVFFWPDEIFALHEQTVEPSYLARLPQRAPNPEASDLVARARAAVIEVFASFGAAHFQVGRAYPLHATRSPEAAALLRAVKCALDPHNRMNPGALGLP